MDVLLLIADGPISLSSDGRPEDEPADGRTVFNCNNPVISHPPSIRVQDRQEPEGRTLVQST